MRDVEGRGMLKGGMLISKGRGVLKEGKGVLMGGMLNGDIKGKGDGQAW